MYRRIQQIEYYVVIANQQCWHANKTWNLYSSNAGIQGNVRKQPVQNIHTHSMHIYHWSTVWLYSQTCIFQIHIFGWIHLNICIWFGEIDAKKKIAKNICVYLVLISLCFWPWLCFSVWWLYEDSIVYSYIRSNQQIEHSGFKGQQIE